ncbi:MAG TPA: DUF1570 domain-containing protein [Thermoguttaceae bacterium]|nr:DUF1570 domain-containing protein [Thermoguttaceae bacterium]
MKIRPPSSIALMLVLTVGGCIAPSKVSRKLPENHSLVREQLVIHSDFPLAAQHRLLEDLTARRFDLARRLAMPLSDEPIHVYLFQDADRFYAFMGWHHPEFPRRRAFFVETDTRLVVYAYWGDRVSEDLRHEITHAYLHSVVPNVPLWLDEGLAEYFEVPRGRDGMHRAHCERLAARLRQGDWQPDLRRLEQFNSAFEMDQDDYAESWAWVHFLLGSDARYAELLQGYLGDLRRNGAAEPVSWRIGRTPNRVEEALVRHVEGLFPHMAGRVP